ncbi:MAG: hypothetical protein EOP04_23385 [Proteobacteria bacterium]|nr:MAG: hypothetical protein EOP04_23385 [Pseudomonadota bacterium]
MEASLGYYISPLIAGIITTSIGFMLFHTAGHNGISKNPKVNTFWYNLYANYVLCFTSKLWNIHHNYGHHSYTNIHKKDPDVSNALAFIRKSPHQQLKPQHKVQWYVAYLLLVFMPNQWFGQVVQYFMSTTRGKIFGIPLLQKEERSKTQFLGFGILAIILITTLYVYQGLFFALITTYLYSFGVGFMYWACVFPNHDTDDTEQTCVEDVVKNGTDWGEHQIRSSSDFWLPDCLTYFIGGMNYQIEHHLFPTVHPRHYPAISKFVQEECKRDVKLSPSESVSFAILFEPALHKAWCLFIRRGTTEAEQKERYTHGDLWLEISILPNVDLLDGGSSLDLCVLR